MHKRKRVVTVAIIKDFIDNIFNNPPICVEPPRSVKVHYNDVGTRLEAYNVRVYYKNGQRKDFSFPVDNDHWKIVSSGKAYNRAYAFYTRKVEKIAARNEKNK